MSANRENAAASGAPLIASGKDALLSLADKCEQATGPDREFDCQIHFATTGFMPRAGGTGWPENALIVPAFPGWQYLPAYTSSIDAALSLVPEWPNNGGYRLTRDHDFRPAFRAEIWEHPDAEPGDGWHRGRGASMPLALCAASLRARSTGGDGDE